MVNLKISGLMKCTLMLSSSQVVREFGMDDQVLDDKIVINQVPSKKIVDDNLNILPMHCAI